MSRVTVPLYEIATALTGLERLIEDGEISSEYAADTFEALEGDFSKKVEQILALYRNHEGFAMAAKAEADRLAETAKLAENRMTWLKDYVQSQMARVGMKSVKTILGTCAILEGAESVVIDELLELPDEYVTYQPELAYVPKKAEIKRAINAGTPVPGAHLVTGESYLKLTSPRTRARGG